MDVVSASGMPGRGSAALMARVPVRGLLSCVYGRRVARLYCVRRPAAQPAFLPAGADLCIGSRIGDQVAVSSSRWGTRIFLYAPSAGSADEAAQVAREVLARHEVSVPVRTEFWSPRDQERRDAADDPSADPVAEQQARHEARQERERQASVTSGRPAREVRVELPSHDDVVALAGYLPPGDGGSARTAGTSSSGRTAKTTLRASPRSSAVTAALMRMRPSGSGGSTSMHPGRRRSL